MLVASGITTLGKTVLLVVAITFIVWSLVTAMVVPRKRFGFPSNMNAYLLASAVLFVVQMTAVVWVTGTQAVEEAHAGEADPGHGETTGGEVVADAAAGKSVFSEAGCGSCHALADAGAGGAVGPNLDETKPAATLVVDRVTNGKGAMPAFDGQLSEQQIADVAAYVSSVAGT